MITFGWKTSVFLGLFLVQLLSCTKQFEKQSDGSLEFTTSSDAVLVSEIADCKLRTISHVLNLQPGTPNVEVKGSFVYHPDGLPAELTYTPGYFVVGVANYYFIYDSNRRLKEMRKGFSRTETSEAEWHKYGYNGQNQINADTLYLPGDPNDPIGSPTYIKYIYQITYDAQNRISKEIVQNVDNGTTHTENYAYDSRGNLVVEGWASSSYDNNKSIFRAHPLFQFIHRNYSNNNSAPQAKYNAKGFPLSSNPINDDFFNGYSATLGGTGVSIASYDCDGFSTPNEFLYCKLRTVSHEFEMPPGTPNIEIKGTFVYHPDGLPGQLTYINGFGANPNYYFIYDNQRRLKELLISHSRTQGSDASVWHKYGYNNFGQIITDTLFNFSGIELSTAYPRGVSTLTYDAQGRVKTETSNVPGGSGGTTITYNYDGRGNLIVGGWPASNYDSKVSIYRAHSLFQFIHRNYSKNNAAVQARYNSKGLPFSVKNSNDNFFNAYPENIGGTGITKANYDCP